MRSFLVDGYKESYRSPSNLASNFFSSHVYNKRNNKNLLNLRLKFERNSVSDKDGSIFAIHFPL